MPRIAWFQRRLVQSGGGERFCLSLIANNLDGGCVYTREYNSDIYEGKYSNVIKNLPVVTGYLGFLISLRGALIKEWKSGSVIITSGTWSHVIDVYLATLFTKIKYDCWIWGSMFQFPSKDEKLKYSIVFRSKINAILQINPVFNETYETYSYKSFGELVRYNCIAFLKYLSVRKSRRLYVLSKLNQLEVKILYNAEAIVDFAFYEKAPELINRIRLNQVDDALSLFTVGRLAENKGLGKMLQVVRELKSSGRQVQFDVFGSGPEYINCQRLISELDLKECVRLHGYTEEKIIDDIVNNNSIFCCYDNADFNLAPMQYSAKGYKVVCAKPFQENAFTVTATDFLITGNSLHEFLGGINKVNNSTMVRVNAVQQADFEWRNLARRLTCL